MFCTVFTQYIIQLHSHTNSNTSTGESTFFCRAPPCFSAARALGPSARQHVPSRIRWTSEQWPRLGAGGCDSKLREKGVHQWPHVCARVCVCVTAGQRGRERVTGLSAIWSIGGRSQMRQKTCVISISLLAGLSPGSKRLLERNSRFLAMPPVMAHTNLESVK